MRRARIREHVLRPLSPRVRAGDQPSRAVLGREVVQHPDRVADPVAALVRDRRHVDVQRLPGVGVRIGGPGVEAAQLHRRTEHVLHAVEHGWQPRSRAGTPRPCPPDWPAGARALPSGTRCPACAPSLTNSSRMRSRSPASRPAPITSFEDDVAVVVQTSFMLVSHHWESLHSGPRAGSRSVGLASDTGGLPDRGHGRNRRNRCSRDVN